MDVQQIQAQWLRKIAEDAGLEVRGPVDGSLRVCLQENYQHTRSPLLWSQSAVASDPGSFARMTDLTDIPIETSALTDAGLDVVRQQSAPVSLAAQFQLEFMFTPGENLSAAMQAFLSERAPLIGGPLSEFHAVLSDAYLPRRAQFPRILTSLAFQRQGLPPISGELGQFFPAAHGLTQDISIGAQLFVLPALSAAAPEVLGVAAARLRASGVWLFGKPLKDTDWPSSRLTDALMPTPRFSTPRGRPATFSVADTGPFLGWWVERSAELLRIAMDPANFRAATDNSYASSRHLAFVASLGRLYRDTAEAMRSTPDSAQLRAAYDALDCLDGLSWKAFDVATSLSRAKQIVGTLRNSLPSPVVKVALPLCERAAQALADVRQGFITKSRHYGPDGLIDMPGKKGPQSIPWDRAVQSYLRLDRNSAHSFRKIEEDPFERALLFSHNGTIPADLAFLPFLHLMDLLANPEHLERKLVAGSR